MYRGGQGGECVRHGVLEERIECRAKERCLVERGCKENMSEGREVSRLGDCRRIGGGILKGRMTQVVKRGEVMEKGGQVRDHESSGRG